MAARRGMTIVLAGALIAACSSSGADGRISRAQRSPRDVAVAWVKADGRQDDASMRLLMCHVSGPSWIGGAAGPLVSVTSVVRHGSAWRVHVVASSRDHDVESTFDLTVVRSHGAYCVRP